MKYDESNKLLNTKLHFNSDILCHLLKMSFKCKLQLAILKKIDGFLNTTLGLLFYIDTFMLTLVSGLWSCDIGRCSVYQNIV